MNIKRVEGLTTSAHEQPSFYPQIVVRYEIEPELNFPYSIVWVCRICDKMLLDKATAINHALICKMNITEKKDIPIVDLELVSEHFCL